MRGNHGFALLCSEIYLCFQVSVLQKLEVSSSLGSLAGRDGRQGSEERYARGVMKGAI
jgi:hypothetical protein